MTALPVPETHERDYAAEMRVILDAEMQVGDAAPVVAARIVAKLRATDPGLLSGWLDLGATSFVREALGQIDRSARGAARRGIARSAFADAGDRGDVGEFLAVRYVVDEQQTRKPLGDLLKPELLYVASEYDADAKSARLEAAFFRAIAKQVGTGRVRDRFDEQRIAELRRSITG
jgi:hypothetical protein